MNTKEILKIIAFQQEIDQLPDELLTLEDTTAFTTQPSNESDRVKVYDKQNKLFNTINDLKIRLLAYFRAVDGNDSTYIVLIQELTFKPTFEFNTIHFQNNKAWQDDKNKLSNYLKMARIEFEEKARISADTPENSLFHFLKSKEAKGAFLTALLGLIVAFITKDYWFVDSQPKQNISAIQISKRDSLVSTDKNKVIDETVNEVFTNYYNTIVSLEERYASISSIDYLDNYVKEEFNNIKSKIANKSYVHRFSSNENLWNDKDFLEVSVLTKSRTIHRIKEFTIEIENKSQGPFFFSEDKLKQLKELALNEINVN